MRFELCEGLFDRVQVWGVGRQITQFRACGFDGVVDVLAFVSAQIVHHDNVAGLEGGNKDLMHISLEALSIHRTVQDHGRGQALGSQPRCEGGDFPVTMRR